MASIARDDPSPLPGMHRDHNALPSQTDRQTDTAATPASEVEAIIRSPTNMAAADGHLALC